jgi:hypothetical protein
LKRYKVSKDLFAATVLFRVSVVFLLFFPAACKQKQQLKTERGFYYWKSRLQFSDAEKKMLEQLKISKLYVKFFDVQLNEDGTGPAPVAKIAVDSSALDMLRQNKTQIAPVVFITNETIKTLDSSGLNLLAENIFRLIESISEKKLFAGYPELQIDCDWTQTTKSQYFFLLQKLKKLMDGSSLFGKQKILSATIRLHQVKYSNKTGVPPVDKSLLMCYNMGNLKNPATSNSILDPSELKSYLQGLNKYPLQLDIALPLFEWHVYFSNQLYKGITSEIKSEELTSSTGKWNQNIFTFERDTVLQNIRFKKGDVLRFEESRKEDIEQCIDFLKQNIHNRQLTVFFYHLDEVILNKHPQHELETLYNRFHL